MWPYAILEYKISQVYSLLLPLYLSELNHKLAGILHVAANPNCGTARCPLHGDNVCINYNKETWVCDEDRCTQRGKIDISPQRCVEASRCNL
jgi:hypothetical protein